jgi:glycosyl-4,4'-diaponeurosporenoate acyltransferase
MPLEWSAGWIVAANVGGWLAIQLGLARLVARIPDSRLRPPPAFAWERGGDAYEHCCAIHRWKDVLPDGGAWFAGGFAKARLARRDPAYLRQFARETWRGELCHWLALCCTPLFFPWNPWWGDLVIAAYAILANLPCILVQRHNRARLQRLLERRENS